MLSPSKTKFRNPLQASFVAMSVVFHFSYLYFLVVFSSAFILGTIRVFYLQPRIGRRYAELLEMPVIVVVCWGTANHIISRLGLRRHNHVGEAGALSAGILSTLWLLTTELGAVAVRAGDWEGVLKDITHRDSVSGPAYCLAVLLYTIMPWYLWPAQTGCTHTKSSTIDIATTRKGIPQRNGSQTSVIECEKPTLARTASINN